MQQTNTSINREQTVTEMLNAPVELVWEAWTQPEHITNWWGPNGFTTTIHKMDVISNGEWLLTLHGPDGKNYQNKSVFLEIVLLKKIVYQHFNPGYVATIEFEPKGNKTFMKWTMQFDTPEIFEIVVRTFKADEGLKQNVEKLNNYVSGLNTG